MKKIEIVQRLNLPKSCKDSVIIIRYPFWMKWLMKFVECYVIPNTYDFKIIYPNLKCYEDYDIIKINSRISEVA